MKAYGFNWTGLGIHRQSSAAETIIKRKTQNVKHSIG
jgi:hypothetical protein